MIYIESKRKSRKSLERQYFNAKFIDVTSKGEMPYVKLSPFYPHGNIPIPYSEGFFSETVEGIWQGLKVFANEEIDPSKFKIKNMKGIKRTVRKLGTPLGHRKGVSGTELLDYISARKTIYLKAYAFVLQTSTKSIIDSLKEDAYKQDIVLLDFDTNDDINNPTKPLSHASLVKKHLEFRFPELKTMIFAKASTTKEKSKTKSGEKARPKAKSLKTLKTGKQLTII